MSDISGLKIVVLSNPYESLESSLVARLLPKIVCLKKEGYESAYGRNILAVGAEDFLATHLLVCSNDESLTPLMGFKSIDTFTCARYKIPFPPENIINKENSPLHHDFLQDTLKRAKESGEPVGYNGSWTILPTLKSDRALVRTFKNLLKVLTYFQYTANNIKTVVAGASTTFKIPEKVHNPLGFKNFSIKGESLPPVKCEFVNGEQVLWQLLTEFTSEAAELANQYRFLWESRIQIDPEIHTEELKQKKKKAA